VGLFLIGGHYRGPLAEDSAAKLKRSQLNNWTVYVSCVLCTLSLLWLKSEPGWPAISVSTSQLFRVGKIVWFGWPYTTWPRWRQQGEGLHSLPLIWIRILPPVLHMLKTGFFFTLSLQGQIRLFSVSIRVISFKIFSILNILLKFSRKSW
jgi:hypothetical protein